MEIHISMCQTVKDKFSQLDNNINLKPKFTSFIYRTRTLSNNKLDLTNFNKVINIDPKNKIAHVQGSISFYDLVNYCLPFNLCPKIVPELRGITIGGAIAGLAVESSSFKYGLFHNTVTEMEILTGNGDIIICSKNNNSDLFYGIVNSYGTLGYILSVKLKLLEVKPYVDVIYFQFNNSETYFKQLYNLCKSGYDFVDGAIFSPTNMVIVIGKYTNLPSYPIGNTLDNIYYKTIQEKDGESFTIKDYLWRWDRDSFWSTNNTILEYSWIRKYLGPYILRTDMLLQMRKWIKYLGLGPINQEEIIQDVGIPFSKCVDFLNWFDKNINIYPIFICPIKSDNGKNPLWQLPSSDMYCDFGFFSSKDINIYDGYYNEKIENFLLEVNGRKSLYSKVCYDKPTFEKLYCYTYNNLKTKYDTNNKFLTLFEKMVK
jgi:hypothetical protein